MSVVSLHPVVLGGSVTFSNRDLRLTATFGAEGPLWQIDPQPASLEGRPPNTLHACFASLEDSRDGSHGSVSENEHGLTGEFYFAPAYFDLLQQAALSAADLEISVIFGAREQRVESLMLTIQHKSA